MRVSTAEGLRIEHYVLKRPGEMHGVNRGHRKGRAEFLRKKEEVLDFLLEIFKDSKGMYPDTAKVTLDSNDDDVKKGIWKGLMREKFWGAYEVVLAYKGKTLIGMFTLIHNFGADVALHITEAMAPLYKGFLPTRAAMIRNLHVRSGYKGKRIETTLLAIAKLKAAAWGKRSFGFIDPEDKKRIKLFEKNDIEVKRKRLEWGYPFYLL